MIVDKQFSKEEAEFLIYQMSARKDHFMGECKRGIQSVDRLLEVTKAIQSLDKAIEYFTNLY